MPPQTIQARAAAELTELIEANRRFAAGEPAGHRFTADDRERLLAAQDPGAVVLGCVDARVPPELIFDQPVGRLLTVRTAGQALAGVALGSIEFGVRVLRFQANLHAVFVGHPRQNAHALRDERAPHVLEPGRKPGGFDLNGTVCHSFETEQNRPFGATRTEETFDRLQHTS